MFKNISKNYEIIIFYAVSIILALGLIYFLYFGIVNLIYAVNKSFLQPNPASANIQYLNEDLLSQIVQGVKK